MAIVTKTLKPSGGDYSDLALWESTEQTDLVAAGDQHVLECDAAEYFVAATGVAINGWTTDASHYITIKAAAGHEHNGVWGSGVRFRNSSGAPVLQTLDTAFDMQDIATSVNLAAAGNVIFCGGPPRFRLDRLMMNGSGTPGTGCNMINPFVATAGWVRNSVIYSGAVGVLLNGDIIIENVTCINQVAEGFDAGIVVGVCTLNNCVAINAGTADFSASKVGASITGSNNASGDATAPGANPVTGITTAAFDNYAGFNFKPAAVGGPLDAAGIDLSGSFTDDVTGTTRTTPWDIGAYISLYVPPPAPAGDGNTTDDRFAALRAQGHTGHVNDMMLQWLQAGGATSSNMADAWREMFVAKGFTTGTWNDRWYALLVSKGFTSGDVTDRTNAFWAAGGIL